MQIPHQLEGKQKALDLFIVFLKEHGLWDRVSWIDQVQITYVNICLINVTPLYYFALYSAAPLHTEE